MVLNVVGSNPTSHPKDILDNHKIIEDFLFITIPKDRETPLLGEAEKAVSKLHTCIFQIGQRDFFYYKALTF